MKTKVIMVVCAFLVTNSALAEKEHDGKHGHQMQEETRQLVEMPSKMQQHMMTKMRDHLAAVSEILQSLGQEDLDKAAEIAESRLGMSSMGKHGGGKKGKHDGDKKEEHVCDNKGEKGGGMGKHMPEGMRTIGHGMHEAASRFALRAQEGNTVLAYQALSEVTASCVACHASYRIK